MTEDISVTKFREYLRIDTEQPEPDYETCTKFLEAYAAELGLEFFVYYPKRPMVILTLPGTDKSLKSLFLYSHTDVVPTFKEHWTHDPYSAFKDDNGRIYGRGAQDMKCVGIQYLEAYRRLKSNGHSQFLRTIHFAFGADEEISGPIMKKFVTTPEFSKLNVGFALDEGLASEDDVYKAFYGERCVWWVDIKCGGSPGHGSRFVPNDAGSKYRRLINAVYEFRDSEEKRLNESNGKLRLGDVTTVNLTQVSGGVQTNVVPDALTATFDIRVTPSQVSTFEDTIKEWVKVAGEGVTYTFAEKTMTKFTTPITDDDDYWKTFSQTLKNENMKYSPEIFTAATDSRYLREHGYKSIGFSPMINTPVLLHDHNEFLDESVFLRGVEVYTKLIKNLASVPKSESAP
ncbi:hypothetical protein FO519_004335 [Halicephalobus sp. NKZ332]|nr:hypothetical protein FO519_004335 [Halicephalobus sp. NKZ332]